MRGEALRWGRRWAPGVAVMGVLAAGVLALGGCTADADAEPGPSVSTSGSPTASASPSQSPIVAPVRPAEMERSDEVGALAAAEYFMELFAYVMATGDVVEWDAVSYGECEFCSRIREDVQRVYEAGGRYSGGALLDVTAVAGPQHPTLGGYPVTVDFSVGPGSEHDAAGAVVRELSSEDESVVVDTVFTAKGWTLVELSVDASFSVYAP